jgi:hypothetical protein
METDGKKALLEHFADLEDPRSRQSPHGLMELLLTAVCAVLSGADGWAGAVGSGPSCIGCGSSCLLPTAWPRTTRSGGCSPCWMPHMVSAFASGLGLTLGQMKTAEKSNEILRHPRIAGCLVAEGLHRHHDINRVASAERRYYISSRPADAEHLGAVVRGHWCVENGLHWSLDVAFGLT